MRGLLLRLSTIDAEAEAALRIIAAFDQLVAQRAEIGGVVRAAAALAECRAGLSDPLHGLLVQVGPDGREVEDGRDAAATIGRASLEGTNGGEVWLERAEGPGPLDDIVVERMAAAALVVLERTYGTAREGEDGALQGLLSERVPEIERVRAARLLGFDDAERVRAVAVAQLGGFGHGATSRRVTSVLRQLEERGEIARAARIGDVFALLTTAAELDDPLPADLRAGVGNEVDVLDAASSWATARAVLRFTTQVPGIRRAPLAEAERLGSLVALASIPAEELAGLPELEVLDALASSTAGCNAIAALDAFVRAGSMRRAAAELHLHHTSVAARVQRAGKALGYTVEDASCGRVHVALTLWQLKHSLD